MVLIRLVESKKTKGKPNKSGTRALLKHQKVQKEEKKNTHGVGTHCQGLKNGGPGLKKMKEKRQSIGEQANSARKTENEEWKNQI